MPKPEQIDVYDEHLMQQMMDEGGIDPDVLQQRRTVQSVLTEKGEKTEDKPCVRGENGTVNFEKEI